MKFFIQNFLREKEILTLLKDLKSWTSLAFFVFLIGADFIVSNGVFPLWSFIFPISGIPVYSIFEDKFTYILQNGQVVQLSEEEFFQSYS